MDSTAFEQLKAKTKQFYDSVDPIYCPALNMKVHFTSEGFNHLRYSKKTERTIAVQGAKLRLVPQAKKLIEKTTTIQEYCDGLEMIHRKRYKKMVKESLMVQYWGFIAVIDGVRLKAVVRRVDNGKYMFWSVMPLWRSMKYDKYNLVNKSTGDLSED